MLPDAGQFTLEWIASWNSHDLERILSHYSVEVVVTSPMIKVALGEDSGALAGKASVRRYWQAALEKVPDLHFELVDYAAGVDSLAIYYKSVMNRMAIEIMFFDSEGKVQEVFAHYH